MAIKILSFFLKYTAMNFVSKRIVNSVLPYEEHIFFLDIEMAAELYIQFSESSIGIQGENKVSFSVTETLSMCVYCNIGFQTFKYRANSTIYLSYSQQYHTYKYFWGNNELDCI